MLRRQRQSSPNQPFQLGLLLLPAFNSMALNAFLDPLRATNYLEGEPIYQWHYLSLDDRPVRASNGLSIDSTIPFDTFESQLDMVVVNASWTPETFQDHRLRRWLHALSRRGLILGGIDTGAFVLAYAGLMDGYRGTVHYEHLPSLRELFHELEASDTLYVLDRDRFTCAGGLAATDMALEMVRQQLGMAVANAAARYIFHERLRSGDERQRPHTHTPRAPLLPDLLREVLLLMEQNLENVIPVPQLARRAGVSQRQLERMFKKHFGVTPKRYYINLRLIRGRALLTQTALSIAEIAGACGFGSAVHFSRSYSSFFKIAPSRDRAEGRIPFQFRLFVE